MLYFFIMIVNIDRIKGQRIKRKRKEEVMECPEKQDKEVVQKYIT